MIHKNDLGKYVKLSGQNGFKTRVTPYALNKKSETLEMATKQFKKQFCQFKNKLIRFSDVRVQL